MALNFPVLILARGGDGGWGAEMEEVAEGHWFIKDV